MFTGLIGGIGIVRELSGGATPRLVVETPLARQLNTGDSIAVSGVCLTALEIKESTFSADLAAETMMRTNLKNLMPGVRVNLELPAGANARLDGHIVQGHIDGTAKLISFTRIGEDWRMVIDVDAGLEKQIVPQGSITVEGISLTVAAVAGRRIEIAIIPHTYEVTNLKTLHPGAPLNIELDVLAKYARKQEAGEKRFTIEELIGLGF